MLEGKDKIIEGKDKALQAALLQPLPLEGNHLIHAHNYLLPQDSPPRTVAMSISEMLELMPQ